jgi:hypothetical protein
MSSPLGNACGVITATEFETQGAPEDRRPWATLCNRVAVNATHLAIVGVLAGWNEFFLIEGQVEIGGWTRGCPTDRETLC